MNSVSGLFSDYTFCIVALGASFTGIISAVLGCFSLLRKQSLMGDGISHACLPGIVIAFMMTGSKNTEIFMLGAFFAGLLSIFLINFITAHSRIKFDSALAFIMSVFFGFGIALLTYIQKFPSANQAGLKNFIFGQASALMVQDIKIMLYLSIFTAVILILFWKELKLFVFDREYCFTSGFKPQLLNMLLSSLMVICIIASLQTVGVILMSAMLITPGAAARQWSDKFHIMVLLSAVFGGTSGFLGTVASSLIPNFPTGPCIVICISLIALISLLFAPGRGIIAKLKKRKDLMNSLKGGISRGI